MLRLLLDEHISRDVARGLRRVHQGLAVFAFTEWSDGSLIGQPDEVCLRTALAEGMTLVTYDRRTIPPILKAWAETGVHHGGVIFVDEKTISPADIGGLIKALARLASEDGGWEWKSGVVFLRR